MTNVTSRYNYNLLMTIAQLTWTLTILEVYMVQHLSLAPALFFSFC